VFRNLKPWSQTDDAYFTAVLHNNTTTNINKYANCFNSSVVLSLLKDYLF